MPRNMAVMALVMAVALPPHALGQEAEDRPVRERPRPDYDAPGVRIGPVLAFPAISASQTYDDNIFADDRDTVGDLVTRFAPTVVLRSAGSRFQWRATAGSRHGLYLDEADENYTDLTASLVAGAEVLSNGLITLAASYDRLHESRESPDDANGSEPTVYDRVAMRAGLRQRFNRLSLSLGVELRDLSFRDTPVSLSGLDGGRIDNGDRDRRDTEQVLRLSYSMLPDHALFVEGALRQLDYVRLADGAGVNRDSDSVRMEAGLNSEISALVSAEVRVGMTSRRFADSDLQSIDLISFGARAKWNVTRLTTVSGRLDRRVEETTLAGATSRIDDDALVRVDHELLRNLIVSAEAGWGKSGFRGSARRDERADVGVSVDYLLARGIALSGSVARRVRESTRDGADFTRDTVRLGLSLGL